jgi:hypothetical protein
MSQITNLIKQNFQLAVSAFGNWKNTYRGKSIVLPFFILPLPPRFLNGLGCILQAHIIDNWIKRSFSSYWLQKQTSNKCTTLQRQNAEISKQIFPEKDYRGLSPNFHINASVSDLYIPMISLPILLEEICRPILGLYKSLTDTWMLKLRLRPHYSQKRNT